LSNIRDNIPIDELLRQYIDETQEVDVYTKEKVIKHEVKEIEEPKPESSEIALPSLLEKKDESLPKPPPEVNIKFEEKVEKYDPVNEEKSVEEINFESKPEPMPYDEDDDLEQEQINIGEDIKLDLVEDGSTIEPDIDAITLQPEKNNAR
jgi:hypothetical protein